MYLMSNANCLTKYNQTEKEITMHTQTTTTTTTAAVMAGEAMSVLGPVGFDRVVEILQQLEVRGIVFVGEGLPMQDWYDGDTFAVQALRTAVHQLHSIGIGRHGGDQVIVTNDHECREVVDIIADTLAIRLTSMGYLEDWISVVKVEKIN